jgi:tetratricopeptide (TPR) repeat protein
MCWAWLLLAGCAAAVAQVDPAESLWRQGLEHYQADRWVEAEEAFRKFVVLNSKHGGGYAYLALCEFQNKKYETAFAHVVLAKQHGLVPGSDLNRVAHLHYLMLANRIGEFELAGALAAELVNARQDTPIVEAIAGLSALRMALVPSEIPRAERDRVALAGRAAVLAWRKRVPEAIETANTLVAKYPKLPNAHYLRAYLLTLSESDAALDEFKKELEISPRHVQARLQIANLYFQRGEAGQGERFAREAVALAPRDAAARAMYGRLLLDQDRLAEAIGQLEQAVQFAPSNADAHYHLANAYTRAGRASDAERHRRRFTELRKPEKQP